MNGIVKLVEITEDGLEASEPVLEDIASIIMTILFVPLYLVYGWPWFLIGLVRKIFKSND